MSAICQHCKEPEYDAEEQVCKACGIVTEGTQFGAEFCSHSSVIPFDSHHYGRRKRPPAGLTFGMDILNSLSNIYNISSVIKAEVIELLNNVYSKNSFRRKQDIGVLAGCCLLQVQRKYQQFVPLPDLCAKLKCSKKTVYKFAKLLKLNCQDSDKFKEEEDDPGESVAPMEYREGIESAIQVTLSSFPESSKRQLTAKTTALVKLAYSLWVGSGRSTEGLISAAAFWCWKSMHPSRRTLAFRAFCTQFSLNYFKSRPRVSELKEMLLKLGKSIPSFSVDYVNEKNVLFHLDYILENSASLRNDLLTDEFSIDEINKKEFSSFRKPRVKPGKAVKKETVVYDPDMRASDIEISDTEIDSYLRTEEQVKMIKALREQKENSES